MLTKLHGFQLHHTFTLMMWIRPDAGGNLYTVSHNDGSEPGKDEFLHLSLDSDITKLRFRFTRDTDELENQAGGGVLMENSWHHIALALDMTFDTTYLS